MRIRIDRQIERVAAEKSGTGNRLAALAAGIIAWLLATWWLQQFAARPVVRERPQSPVWQRITEPVLRPAPPPPLSKSAPAETPPANAEMPDDKDDISVSEPAPVLDAAVAEPDPEDKPGDAPVTFRQSPLILDLPPRSPAATPPPTSDRAKQPAAFRLKPVPRRQRFDPEPYKNGYGEIEKRISEDCLLRIGALYSPSSEGEMETNLVFCSKTPDRRLRDRLAPLRERLQKKDMYKNGSESPEFHTPGGE